MAHLGFFTKIDGLVLQHARIPKCGLEERDLVYGDIPEDSLVCRRCLWQDNYEQLDKFLNDPQSSGTQFPLARRKWLRWPF